MTIANLSGKRAFYNQSDYKRTTLREFANSTPLAPTYTVETEHSITRSAKNLFSKIIFPIALYQRLQTVAARFLLPSMSEPLEVCTRQRTYIPLKGSFKYKRLTIEVDGVKIDAMIVGKPSTLNNGRWILNSNPNAVTYERYLAEGKDLTTLLRGLNANALVFNYPGVGASEGAPSKSTMEKVYRAMLKFLEEEVRAKEIIAYGRSMGGGAQAAVDGHPCKPHIKYVFVKDRTFSSIYSVASSITNRVLAFLTLCLRWNIDTANSSKKLTTPEIIIQTAHVKRPTLLKHASQVKDDGLITAEASLAQTLLRTATHWKNKVFIGVKEDHFETIEDTELVISQIKKFLR